ncbi:hypothetical protein [Deinococcus humi]|uniref:Uncharacterized protein n=1 Tax=Deinococcus humi TaxID=662880 RepID=A0A7W8JQG2_9DEIO|nr:hypothetical protein [Deinococcus humi]MBB5361312.1 hypothetical protein [Deinococcus humi]GGO19436.1 hypothetical protein GCM10008949_03780 [Deinococcus humi]
MKGLRLILLAPVFVLLSAPSTTVRATLTGVDRVERELRLEGQRRPFVGTFSSQLKVDGLNIQPGEFWRTVRPGMEAVIKSRSYGPFRIVDVASVRTGEE